MPTPPLRAEARTEVAIVGAGYTGLSTALHLAERGTAVTLLEAHEPGWGAAGRNGGQVNAGLKHEPDEVEAHLRRDLSGRAWCSLPAMRLTYLFGLIARLGIECEARREGTIRAARGAKHAAALQRLPWSSGGSAVRRCSRSGMRHASRTRPARDATPRPALIRAAARSIRLSLARGAGRGRHRAPVR